jgi:hypothetical protein
VRWVFSGRSADGQRLRRPVSIYPTVRDNVAIAPLVRDQGQLASATWYDTRGRVIASYGPHLTTWEELRASFAALRRPRTQADALPNDAAMRHMLGTGPPSRFGLQLNLSRRVIATQTETIWLVPGLQDVCTIERIGRNQQATSGGMACTSPAAIEQYGSIGYGDRSVTAVLPDRSSDLIVTLKDGSSVRLAPNRDGAIARTFNQPVNRFPTPVRTARTTASPQDHPRPDRHDHARQTPPVNSRSNVDRIE